MAEKDEQETGNAQRELETQFLQSAAARSKLMQQLDETRDAFDEAGPFKKIGLRRRMQRLQGEITRESAFLREVGSQVSANEAPEVLKDFLTNAGASDLSAANTAVTRQSTVETTRQNRQNAADIDVAARSSLAEKETEEAGKRAKQQASIQAGLEAERRRAEQEFKDARYRMMGIDPLQYEADQARMQQEFLQSQIDAQYANAARLYAGADADRNDPNNLPPDVRTMLTERAKATEEVYQYRFGAQPDRPVIGNPSIAVLAYNGTETAEQFAAKDAQALREMVASNSRLNATIIDENAPPEEIMRTAASLGIPREQIDRELQLKRYEARGLTGPNAHFTFVDQLADGLVLDSIHPGQIVRALEEWNSAHIRTVEDPNGDVTLVPFAQFDIDTNAIHAAFGNESGLVNPSLVDGLTPRQRELMTREGEDGEQFMVPMFRVVADSVGAFQPNKRRPLSSAEITADASHSLMRTWIRATLRSAISDQQDIRQAIEAFGPPNPFDIDLTPDEGPAQ